MGRAKLGSKLCPSCSEASPSDFDVCWNCSASIADSPIVPGLVDSSEDAHAPEDQDVPEAKSCRKNDLIETLAILLINCAPLLITIAFRGASDATSIQP